MQRVGTRGRVLYIRQHQTIPGMMATPKKLSLEQQDHSHSHKYKGVYLDLLRSILILPKVPTISCPINQRTVKSSEQPQQDDLAEMLEQNLRIGALELKM